MEMSHLTPEYMGFQLKRPVYPPRLLQGPSHPTLQAAFSGGLVYLLYYKETAEQLMWIHTYSRELTQFLPSDNIMH